MAITRAISKSLKGEPGDTDTPDRAIDMGGTKVVIKSSHKDIYKGIAPFVLVQLAALGLCMIFPEIVLYLPRRFGFLD